LRPAPSAKPLEKFRRYTESWKVPASQPDSGDFRVWSTDEAPPSHSVPPNVAVKAAAAQGRFDRYHLALMRAYFFENRNVTDRTTLLAVADECDLDRVRFEADLADEQIERAVLRDHNEAFELGITAVPTVLVDGDVALPGAQDLRFYRHVIERRLAQVGGTRG
jgi:predicted DsbA family dithiol-disulfide isomerase